MSGPGSVLLLSDCAPLDAIEFPDNGMLYLASTGALYQGEPSPGRAAGDEGAIVNVREVEAVADAREGEPAGYGRRATRIGPALGATRLGAGVYEADPGMRIWPYHYEVVEEELASRAGRLPRRCAIPTASTSSRRCTSRAS